MESLNPESRNRISLTQQAHDAIRPFVSPGDIVIDATVGNGHDSLFLSQLVGRSGVVYGFDIQSIAIDNTNAKLDAFYSSEYANVQHLSAPTTHLFQSNHANLAEHLDPSHLGAVACVMMNLGYLPGGSKETKTQVESTRAAIHAAMQCLRSHQSCLSVIAYTGHEGGVEEAEAVEQELRSIAKSIVAKQTGAKLTKSPSQPSNRSPIHFLLVRPA